MLRRALSFALLAGHLAGCAEAEPPAPSVVLRIEDSLQILTPLGAQVSGLVLADESGNLTELAPAASGFPMRVTLTSKRAGPQLVTVDAYATDANSLQPVIVVRGHATVDIGADDGKEIPLALTIVCLGDTTACPPMAPSYAPCASDAACDDGVFCNGEARCVDGVCRFADLACPPSPDGCVVSICYESEQLCQAVASGLEGCSNDGCVPQLHDDDCLVSVCTPDLEKTEGNEIQADGTACDEGTCYGGACGTPPASCSGTLIDFADVPDGTTLGGSDNAVSYMGLEFLANDPSDFIVAWQVVGSNRELVPGGDANSDVFTFSVRAPLQLASLRIRTGHAERCAVTFTPALDHAVDYVRATDYATLRFRDGFFASEEDQVVRMTVGCENDMSPQTLRIDDICLERRPDN